MLKRISFLSILAIMVISAGIVFADDVAQPEVAVQEQVILVSARKFEFTPNVIKLKKGVPVILEFTSADVVMGFNAPDFKSRVSIIPGVKARVRIVPQEAGNFVFFCDVFCGDGHEDMTGMITVSA